jgi:AraC-like DNA-binding protein/mannose-6-phosphate isomerase-like protein (cupin superfamily)
VFLEYFPKNKHDSRMVKKRQVAEKTFYFDSSEFPLRVLRVATDAAGSPSHPHDLTEQKHQHDFCELVIVTRGRAMHWLEERDFPVTAGDVFLLQGKQSHYFHQRDNLSLINVMYDPEQISLPENDLRKLPGYCALFLLEPAYRRSHRFASRLHLGQVDLAHAEQLAVDMELEHERKEPGFEAVLRAKLIELMVYLSRQYNSAESTEAHALLRVGSVIGALENDFSKDWKLEELQAIAHMSRSNLMRVFRRATGQTPIDYLIRLRVQKAMELMRDPGLTITDIAVQTGFNDSNYFSRQFRRIVGVSPRTFRASFS